MTRRPHRRRDLRRSDRIPVGLIAISLAALIAIVAGFAWLYVSARERNPELDPNNLCPTAGPVAQVLVLVDVTDPIATITQGDIINQLDMALSALPKGGLFELRILEANSERTKTIFSLCNPGDGSDLDHLTGNPERARQQWAERFAAPLQNAMNLAMQQTSANHSPIMAAIQQIAVDRLGSQHGRSIPSRLIVISDMLENTSAFSMYRSGPDYDTYLETAAAKYFDTDLANSEVEIWQIRRDATINSRAVAQFWATWVTNNNGRFGRALQLQGMTE